MSGKLEATVVSILTATDEQCKDLKPVYYADRILVEKVSLWVRLYNGSSWSE